MRVAAAQGSLRHPTKVLAARDKNGIVFFKDCFQRPGEVAVRGDHIDVWMLGVAKTYVAKQCGRRSPRRRRRATWRMPAPRVLPSRSALGTNR